MTNELPTIKIQNKDYVLVKDRVAYFNDTYANGMIQTKVEQVEKGLWISEAIVTPDAEKPMRFFTGHSQAREDNGMINKTSAAENCETSAVGRALAMMGIGVVESIASADEVTKAVNQQPTGEQIIAKAAAKREPTEDHICQIHGVQMKPRISPQGGNYWDHRHKNTNDEWERCMGYGWKGDMKRSDPTPRIVEEAKVQYTAPTIEDDMWPDDPSEV